MNGVDQKKRIEALDVLFIRSVVRFVREVEAQCGVVFPPARRKVVR